jgi:hypothetical protein
MVAGALLHFQQRGYWQTETDYQQGYNAFAELQASMTNNCLTELIESNNRLYRLIDASLNGTTYTADGSTPPVVSPAIPAAPGAVDGVEVGLRRQLLEAQGIMPGGWPFGFGAKPATTADVVRAMRNDSQAQIDRVKSSFSALQTLSQGATIFSVVEDFLVDGAQITAEGGILATLIVSTMAQAAMMGAQAAQLDDLVASVQRLVTSLDGGATPAPTTNVISELESINTLLG